MDREERFKCLEIAATIISTQPDLHEVTSKEVSDKLLGAYQIVSNAWDSIRNVPPRS